MLDNTPATLEQRMNAVLETSVGFAAMIAGDPCSHAPILAFACGIRRRFNDDGARIESQRSSMIGQTFTYIYPTKFTTLPFCLLPCFLTDCVFMSQIETES